MNVRYIDAHCHLQLPEYDTDREDIIKKMHDEGIAGIVVGVDYETSKDAVLLAEKHEHLFATVALHPVDGMTQSFDESAFAELAQHPKVVGIGECGLDYFRLGNNEDEIKKAQAILFKKHLALAKSVEKPLMIHARPTKGGSDAYQDLVTLLTEAKKEYPELSGNVHFYVGSVEEMQKLVALNFSVSFTAVVTFTHDYDKVITKTPETHLLAETDAPFVAPASRRGTRNDPFAVIDVVAQLAEIRETDTERMRKQLLQNTLTRFNVSGITTS